MDCRLLVLRYSARGLAVILVAAALVTFSGGAGFCAPSDYLGHVNEALTFLEQGITGKGVEALKHAFACNANDPLAHVAMGLALLSANRPDDALIEFNIAKDIDKNCAQAHYGKGLAYLAKAGPGMQIPDQRTGGDQRSGADQRKLDAAIAAFSTAAQADSGIDARGPIEYCKGIQIGKYARLDGGNLQ
ncbi:MAG: hypothetical protein M1133_12110, partial [Armatimonadetes bacterium]|nr:hypothetical protein [Armatimonadota bacterium]